MRQAILFFTFVFGILFGFNIYFQRLKVEALPTISFNKKDDLASKKPKNKKVENLLTDPQMTTGLRAIINHVEKNNEPSVFDEKAFYEQFRNKLYSKNHDEFSQWISQNTSQILSVKDSVTTEVENFYRDMEPTNENYEKINDFIVSTDVWPVLNQNQIDLLLFISKDHNSASYNLVLNSFYSLAHRNDVEPEKKVQLCISFIRQRPSSEDVKSLIDMFINQNPKLSELFMQQLKDK